MSLIEILKNEIGTSVIDQISKKVGISTEQANSAVNASIPVMLAGILKNNSSLSGSDFLGNILPSAGARFFSNEDNNLENENWLSKGKVLLEKVFGNNSSVVTNSLANHVGVSEEKSSTLIALILPLVTGAISKLIAKNDWSITDFVSKLWKNKSEISAALPAGLGTSLGLANLHFSDGDISPIKKPVVEIPNVERTDIHRPRIVRPEKVDESEQNAGSILKWLIPIILIALALWYFLGREGCNKTGGVLDSTKVQSDTAMHVIKGKLNEAGDYIFDLGGTISKKLPNGKEISIGSKSVENNLISFIEDKNKMVDKETWFTFDRLYFETGKSVLKTESQNQLENIAAILSAFPSVKLKLGGYTDNTGDTKINKTISNERANAALKALIALGVDASRLEAEGYGDEHPIATNDTPEGRAQNRRIDIRVINK